MNMPESGVGNIAVFHEERERNSHRAVETAEGKWNECSGQWQG